MGFKLMIITYAEVSLILQVDYGYDPGVVECRRV